MILPEHGKFSVKVADKLLIVEATGPFNEEIVVPFARQIESCVTELESGSWNQIVILHKMSVFTPAAEKAFIQTLIDRKARGLVASAVVIAEDYGRNMIEVQMHRCYQTAGVKDAYFNSKEDARAWLAQFS